MRLDDYRPLEEFGKEGDSLFKSIIMQKTNRYFDYIITIPGKYTIFVIAIRKESKTYLLNGLSITTREKKSNTTEIGTAPLRAQASHISCGLW